MTGGALAIGPESASCYSDGMSGRRLAVIGAGGHGKVVLEAAAAAWSEIVMCDDAPGKAGQTVLGLPIMPRAWLNEQPRGSITAIVAVGDNRKREEIQDWVLGTGLEIVTVIHPSAIVSSSARIDPGVFIAAGAVVCAEAHLGRGAIINTRASVDHGTVIGPFAHVGPGVSICGDVSIGARCLIGTGACIVPSIEVGADSVIGAGAAVTVSIPRQMRVGGVPARRI